MPATDVDLQRVAGVAETTVANPATLSVPAVKTVFHAMSVFLIKRAVPRDGARAQLQRAVAPGAA